MVMKRNPRVSVIVPNYNHARYLRKRIDSILRQTYSDFELILLDDCSTDDSLDIFANHADDPRTRIDCNATNSGSTFKQWNKGVRLARGEFVWIAESDDYADPRLLETLVNALSADSNVTFAYCRSYRILEDGSEEGFFDSFSVIKDRRRWATDFRCEGRSECERYFVHSNPVPNASAVVFRKAAYEHVGGADETMLLCGDWKLWAGMALQGHIVYSSAPLNYFRVHDESVSSRSKSGGLAVAESLEVVNWILQQVTLPETVKKDIRRDFLFPWVAAMVGLRVPARMKWRIFCAARTLDPHALRRMWKPIPTIVRLKFQ
jgi:glycosyltransferase involved in cell wall biosynthesis